MSDCIITRRGGSGGSGTGPQLNPSASVELDMSEEVLLVTDATANGYFTNTVSIYKNGTFVVNQTMTEGKAKYTTDDFAVGDAVKVINHNPSFTDSNEFTHTLTDDDIVGFGDGSKNKITNGYGGYLMVNNTLITMGTAYNYFSGNLNNSNIETLFKLNSAGYESSYTPLFSRTTSNYGQYETSESGDCYQAWMRGYSGVNTYPLVNVPTSTKRRTCVLTIYGGSWTSSQTIYTVKFTADGNTGIYWSFQELIDNNVIEPLVLVWSGASNGDYCYHSALNIIDGNSVGSGTYPTLTMVFILKPEHTIDTCQSQLARDTATAYPDGIGFTWFNFNLYKIIYKGPSDSIEKLTTACASTTFCRLSTTSGDKGTCGGRIFTRTSTEPVIISTCFTGSPESSTSNYVSFAFISKSNTLTGTAGSYGDLTDPVSYTLASGHIVYIYTMRYAWQTCFATTSGAEIIGTSVEFTNNEVYFEKSSGTFVGDKTTEFLALVERMYNLS